MTDFTLLQFDWDDSVARVQSLRAPTTAQAVRIADTISLAHPGLAGYQLWHGGERLATTFPRSDARHRAACPLKAAG